MFMSYRLLVIICNRGYGHVPILSTSCYEEASAPFMPYTNRLLPRPWMVACDDDRILPNKFDPFDWFIPSMLDELARRAISTTSRVVALRVVSSSAISMAVSRRCPRSFLTNSIRSIGLRLTCWTHSHEERSRLHPESLHLG
jgi:hypothetical protein